MGSEVRATGWIPSCIVAFIASIFTGYLLIQEIRVRGIKKAQGNKPLFETKWLSLSSIGCLIFGFLGNVCSIMYTLHGICHVMGYLQAVCLWLQPLCLIIYQFHQLYLINKRFEAQKFPRWVFIVLDIIGIIAVLNIFAFPALFIQTKCGINKRLEYYHTLSYSLRRVISIWFANLIITGLLIEALGLFLYAYKLKSFRNYKLNDGKIKAILGRIITLTVVNDIFAVLAGFIVSYLQANKFDQTNNDLVLGIGLTIYTIGYLSPSIVVSNSMRLMIPHNTDDYVKFLRLLLKVKCICCCIKGDLRRQSLFYIVGNCDDHNSSKNQSSDTERALETRTKSDKSTEIAIDTGDESTRGYAQKGSQTHMKEIGIETC